MNIWRKSSHSDETGGHCVELAHIANGVAVRDSKDLESGHLTLTPGAFATLIDRVKRDELPR
ncbi:DUF397 domain-containing protein [Actinomadura soli]|uniref:DUF397 domain-containing protein n=1 Tax=Actinomadura soli TaxID=2508997 RepID=A0A5C4JEX6_9ACTN|nr:DUF397 domain-containing protein [Actinomadura soli]TMR03104.1 DUF397 domain-containing protein [Actinomadura soli]